MEFVDLLRKNRNYRYTWMGQVVSEIGDHFNNIAVFDLAMKYTGSGMVVTGVMLSRAVPAILIGRKSSTTTYFPGRFHRTMTTTRLPDTGTFKTERSLLAAFCRTRRLVPGFLRTGSPISWLRTVT